MESITKKISLSLLDEPDIAMRSDVHTEDIESLMSDMREVGLIEPIVVREKSGRYEIIAGHRRTTAARRLGWAMIEAKIIEATDEESFTMRVIENLSRVEVDPVDEACFIAEIIEKHKKEPREIAEMLHRSQSYVNNRLEIFHMPEYLQELLKFKRIPIAAAMELNKIKDEADKKYYCNYAANQGCSVSTAKRWCVELNSRKPMSDAERQALAIAGEQPEYERKKVACSRCSGECYLDEADMVWVHPISCSPEDPLYIIPERSGEEALERSGNT